MALGEDLGLAAAALLEGKQRDLLAADELRGDGAADAARELRLAHRDVLLDLHDAVAVVAALRLHGQDVFGLVVGWFTAGRIAAKDSERYTMDALSHARYVQAKERASLVRLLENKEVQKAEDLLYIVLGGNFKDYASTTDNAERNKACELLTLLGPKFLASTQDIESMQPNSRRGLIESIRAATQDCGAK